MGLGRWCGEAVYSPTWAEVDLHWSTYLSQALSKPKTSVSTKAGSREGHELRDPTHYPHNLLGARRKVP